MGGRASQLNEFLNVWEVVAFRRTSKKMAFHYRLQRKAEFGAHSLVDGCRNKLRSAGPNVKVFDGSSRAADDD